MVTKFLVTLATVLALGMTVGSTTSFARGGGGGSGGGGHGGGGFGGGHFGGDGFRGFGHRNGYEYGGLYGDWPSYTFDPSCYPTYAHGRRLGPRAVPAYACPF